MKRSLSIFGILCGLLAGSASAQVAIKYQGSTGNRTEPSAYKVPTGFSDTYNAGSTLTVNGTLSGTPSGGTLNLSNVTLTLPGTFITAAQVAAGYQPLHANLTAIAGLTGAADRLFYFNGTTTVAVTTFTDVARQLLDDATVADMRTTLGLGTLATQSGTFSGTSSGTNTGDQTITLTGDVTGTGTGSFAATIQANSVALGNDTTGNYVATIADSGASEITVANSGAESAAVTLALAASITRDSEVTAAISALSSVYQPLEASLTALAGGSDFVAFTGPTTSTKTFTLPNSSATLLYSGGALGTPASGDASNLTGTASSLTAGSVAVVDSTDSTSFVLIVDSATGNLVAKTDAGIAYNSASGGLTITGPIVAGSGTEFKNTWIKSGNSTGIKLGADDGNTTVTDATDKAANVSMPHYNTAEEDVAVFRLFSSLGSNTLSIGGGSGVHNVVTSVRFYTASNNTTTSGTNRGGFDSAGKFDVTATTASNNTTSGSAVFGGGIGVGGAINAGGYIKAGGPITADTSITLGVGGNPLKLWWGADLTNLDSLFLGYNNGGSLASDGQFNTGIGISALTAITSGDWNTVIGYEAGSGIVTANGCTLVGFRSGYQGTGSYNTFLGNLTFDDATSGSNNSGLGASALSSLTSGGNNTALGAVAGNGYTTHSGGVFIGYYAGRYATAGNEFIVNNQDRTDAAGDQTKSLLYGTFSATAAGQTLVANAHLSSSVSLGYSTGAGGSITQDTNRTTGVTLDKVSGAITLVSAAGSTSWQSFTVTNATVAATDVVIVSQKSGTDKYMIHVTAVAGGSFVITYATTGGTTTEQPIFNFAVIKAVTS